MPVGASRVTDPPWQKVVAPTAVMVGKVGTGFTVTTVAALTELVQVPEMVWTVKLPPVVTLMVRVVALLLQR